MNSRNSRAVLAAAGFATALVLAACSDYRETGDKTDGDPAATSERRPSMVVTDKANMAISDYKSADPSIQRFFDSAYAYAVFPEVAKGAAGVGAAHGDGVVYRGGAPIGGAEVTQVTIGFQLGGQSYREIVFFQDERAFNKFANDDLEFSANASAVAVKSGAAAQADYDDGVAVFVYPHGGLMFEASVGGQKFDYHPQRQW